MDDIFGDYIPEVEIKDLVHWTKQGQSIPINKMDDTHLINTINLHIRKLGEAKEVLNQGENVTKFDKLIGRAEFMDEFQAESFVEFSKRKLPLCVFEAILRNIDVKESIDLVELQKLLGVK